MAIATALRGFNDLGHSVTSTYLSRNRFYLQWSTHCPKMSKNWAWEVFKIQDFCPRDIKSCHLATARCVKRWSLNSNLSPPLKEPHQLTIHLIGPLKQYLAENISIQTSNCNILGLTDTVALSPNEARVLTFRVFFVACSLQNEVGDPQFFLPFWK